MRPAEGRRLHAQVLLRLQAEEREWSAKALADYNAANAVRYSERIRKLERLPIDGLLKKYHHAYRRLLKMNDLLVELDREDRLSAAEVERWREATK